MARERFRMDTEETEVTEIEENEEVETETEESKIDWKAMSRKHERQAKKLQKDHEALQAQLKEREEADQSEQEKAIAAARTEGEKTARTAAEKERRADRLESATIRLAAKGVTVKDTEGKALSVTFADADDAFTYVERAVRRGEIDEDDMFDSDGKVHTEALTSALTDILASKPHLASNSEPSRKVQSGADGGKGSGGGKSLEDMTPDDWFRKAHAA